MIIVVQKGKVIALKNLNKPASVCTTEDPNADPNIQFYKSHESHASQGLEAHLEVTSVCTKNIVQRRHLLLPHQSHASHGLAGVLTTGVSLYDKTGQIVQADVSCDPPETLATYGVEPTPKTSQSDCGYIGLCTVLNSEQLESVLNHPGALITHLQNLGLTDIRIRKIFREFLIPGERKSVLVRKKFNTFFKAWKNKRDNATKKGHCFEPSFKDCSDVLKVLGWKPGPDYDFGIGQNDKHYAIGNVIWQTKVENQHQRGYAIHVAAYMKATGLKSRDTAYRHLKKHPERYLAVGVVLPGKTPANLKSDALMLYEHIAACITLAYPNAHLEAFDPGKMATQLTKNTKGLNITDMFFKVGLVVDHWPTLVEKAENYALHPLPKTPLLGTFVYRFPALMTFANAIIKSQVQKMNEAKHVDVKKQAELAEQQAYENDKKTWEALPAEVKDAKMLEYLEQYIHDEYDGSILAAARMQMINAMPDYERKYFYATNPDKPSTKEDYSDKWDF